jgi:gliding motility-associated-like protein
VIGNPIADAGPDQLSCVGALIQLDGTATGGLGAPTGACVYQINMQDTFGDGWNGFTLNVTSGGVTTPITLAGGVSSSATFTVAVGANFSISSTGGTANSQISYSLINDLGVAIYNEGTGVTTGFEYNGIGSCDNFNIQWTPIPTISNANILDPTFTVGANSTMILTVQEGLCQDADTMTIIADPSGTIEIIRLDTLVCGTYPASAVPVQMYLNTTTAPGTTYAWTGPVASTISNSSIENPIVSPSATTTYSLTIGLPAGCTYSDEMKITFRNPPITSVSQTDTICKGQQAPLIVSGGAYWEWLNDDDLSCNSCTNPVATPEYSTTYYLNTYSEYWCRTRDSILVIVYPNVILDVTPKYSEVYKGETVTFDSEGFYSTINWDKELYLSDSSVANPICTPNSSITYIIEAQDALGICKETDTVFVNYLGCQGFKMPTAFSPNGDNSNDVLYVLQSGFESFDELSIYNRWGELIFNTENIGNGWNGTYKGVPQEIGTYVYNIKGTCEGNKIDVKGNISLLR